MEKILKKNKELFLFGGLIVILLLILIGIFLFSKINENKKQDTENIIQEEVIILVNPFSELNLEADAVFVKNISTGEVIFNKNENKILPLASITKLFTAGTAYDLFGPEKLITIKDSDLLQEGDVSVYAGETFSVKSLIDIILISSSNDLSSALASGAESKENFIKHMNIFAKKAGLEDTTLFNETGLDINTTETGGLGTAKDISNLAEYIFTKYPSIFEATKISQIKKTSMEGIAHTFYNTNSIVNTLPNILGSKTGYTDMAGGNLVVIIDPGLNTPIVITVLGSTREGRFSDVEKLTEALLTYFSEKK